MTTTTNMRDAILEALAPLAAAADTTELAGMLAGCLGFSWPHLTIYCPVCHWLREHLPEDTPIRVGTSAVHVGRELVLLPQIVRQFIREYDDGRWPQLVDNPRRLWIR